MRIKCKTYEGAETLARLFGESHIEYEDNKCYLVVDNIKKKAVA